MGRCALACLVATALAACGSDWKPAFDETIQPGQVDSVTIADLDDALTFARSEASGIRRVIAVTSYRDARIDGVDLDALFSGAEDPIRLFLEHGYDVLRDAVRRAAPASRISVPASTLTMPVDLRDHSIAAGTNFPEHAGDAGTQRPFLFPKLVTPTSSGAPVSAGSGLLDYEVELAFVPLESLAEGTAPRWMGLILCNDYTDRETLMRAVDVGDIESGKGFTTGKSFPGYLPVGNLFVIPRDFHTFTNGVELRLYVDDELRQKSSTDEMIWSIDEILTQTWARRNVFWEHRGQQVSLLGESTVIPARTLIMTGTPHGTVFSGIPAGSMIAGMFRWLLGGWGESIPSQVIAAYVDAARSARAYLQPGDRVLIRVDRLGVIQNQVIR